MFTHRPKNTPETGAAPGPPAPWALQHAAGDKGRAGTGEVVSPTVTSRHGTGALRGTPLGELLPALGVSPRTAARSASSTLTVPPSPGLAPRGKGVPQRCGAGARGLTSPRPRKRCRGMATAPRPPCAPLSLTPCPAPSSGPSGCGCPPSLRSAAPSLLRSGLRVHRTCVSSAPCPHVRKPVGRPCVRRVPWGAPAGEGPWAGQRLCAIFSSQLLLPEFF